MKSWAKIILATILLIRSFDADAQNESKVSPVVRVISNAGFGSGTLIDGNMVITAAHCIIDPNNTLVVLSNGELALKAEVIHISKAADIAVLKIQNPNSESLKSQKFAKLASRTETIAVGDRVFLRGFPWGQRAEETTGVLTGVSDQMLETDAKAVPGNSGGGLYNSRDELIGVPWGTNFSSTLCVPMGEIHKSLDQIRDGTGSITHPRIFYKQIGYSYLGIREYQHSDASNNLNLGLGHRQRGGFDANFSLDLGARPRASLHLGHDLPLSLSLDTMPFQIGMLFIPFIGGTTEFTTGRPQFIGGFKIDMLQFQMELAIGRTFTAGKIVLILY